VEDAVPSTQVIADTRFDPAQNKLGEAKMGTREGWWPFLIMSMCVYAFLPRFILWVVSKLGCSKLLRESFLHYPGADLVLVRMSSPVVKTQAESITESPAAAERAPEVTLNRRLVLLNWADALATEEIPRFEEFRPVPAQNVATVGLQSLERDLGSIEKLKARDIDKLLVAVKAWEPPIADLADFLAEFSEESQCVFMLLPLPGRSVTEDNLAEWRAFARKLLFSVVDVQPLNRS
jgi:hypothetical protein